MADNVLLIGGGGRENALAKKLRQSPHVGEVYVAPGNDGTHLVGARRLITGFSEDSFVALALAAKQYNVKLVVIGPELPQAGGIVDYFRLKGFRVFGAMRRAAEIETSKEHFRKLAAQTNFVRVANGSCFGDLETALFYTNESTGIYKAPCVVKAVGPVPHGDSVRICRTGKELQEAIISIASRGLRLIVEEFVEGDEASIVTLVGTAQEEYPLLHFPPSRDWKQVKEGDPRNTGGMGALVSVPGVSLANTRQMRSDVEELLRLQIAYDRFPESSLFYPNWKVPQFKEKMLECNRRWPDPETQAYMALMESDLYELLSACVDGGLKGYDLRWNPGYAVNVVLASGEYPSPFKTGVPIFGLDDAEKIEGVTVIHAGTLQADSGKYYTASGRVLNVVAVGATVAEACERAYGAAQCISFEGMQYRTDIGQKEKSLLDV